MPERLKHIGVDSFFAERDKLLNAYDEAKKQASDDAVKTEHGVTGEAAVRKWLQSFLPKRFGVCKGYIITINRELEGALEEWDVLVYDAMESPVLFTRGPGDADNAEAKRAIPVEHVRAVVEVKATLSPTMAKKCTDKLLKLEQFLGDNRDSEYPLYLSDPFVCAALFLETKVDTLSQYRQALDNLAVLYQRESMIPFMGGLVLRSQRNREHSGYLLPMLSDEPTPFPDVFEMSSDFKYHDGTHGTFGTLHWGVNNYPRFLFDFLALIRGTRSNKLSSFYGLDFGKTQGSRLFHQQKAT